MRYLTLLLVLLAAPAMAQTPPPVNIPRDATWVGVLEGRDTRQLWLPTIVQLRIATDGTIKGEWRSLRPHQPTGLLEGRLLDKGRMEVTVSLFGGGELDLLGGKTLNVGPERCAATGRFEGAFYASGVLRLTARRLLAPDVEHECNTIEHLVWMLQPDQH